MTGAISFDSNSLQTFNQSTRVGIVTNSIDFANIPNKVLNLYQLAHANQSVIPFINYPSKQVTIAGAIVGSTQADLDSRLDTFRAYFNGVEKNLDINFSGATRRFTATVNTINITRSVNGLYATFSIEFICTIPFGYDTGSTTALNGTGRTSSVYTDNYTFLGTAPVQLPVATITLTAVSSTGSQQLFWGNNGNGQGITITRSNWTTGDVVIIDCVNRTVKVNGVSVDFTGAFPEFPPGSQAISYSDTFTSRTMTENVVYNKRYL